MNRTAAQSLRGEQDNQEGLSKEGALDVSLSTKETIGFSRNDLVNECQELLQIHPETLSAGRKGRAVSQGARAGNKEVKLRKGKCQVSSRKHFPE